MMFGCCAAADDYEHVSRAGFDYIELPCRAITAMDEDAFAHLARAVEGGPIPALAMNIYCPPEVVIAGPGFDLGIARRYAERAARRAHALGAYSIGIGSPLSRRLPDGFPHVLANSQAQSFLSITADVFGRYGITVCFEALAPVFCNFVGSLWEAAALVKAMDHEFLALVLDFYNMELYGEADRAFDELLPLVRHAHISDDAGKATMRSVLLPEKYPIHLERLDRLRRSGYRFNLSLEIDVHVDEAATRESLNIMRRGMRQSPIP